ncbi:MAG: glycosyltransferase family 1 protein [Chloroflexi bacterium AL-W]|nr:glycosyltransferase family 1 protein [Chloroflexi bacterium AL-N1]NOK68577.1 glycosyltransferase family 1 protein [Chloroflexi bacterium AL-N10]NOK76063.1 glycosyltransferase family 1 protein [Chloroflexi bacterium AL-N5]NOK82536.1 glycosyltransferase family 1 protein [Chloroflexi bacterium AL-W]NOK92846.1 glycosyltransferase family 1 protein [Chloroflexi bacterium AL-N15]
MRIGIDVRYLSHGLVGGVHTYIAHFVPALIDLAEQHHIFLYADTKRPFELQNLPNHVAIRYLPWHNPLSSVQHDLFMQRQLTQDRLDVMHYPANYGFAPSQTKTVITLHDAINVMPLHEIIRGHPKNPRTIALMSYLHYCTVAAIRHADLLLTVSAHARREIIHYSTFASDRIVPVPHAPTPDLQRIIDSKILSQVRQRHHISTSFVLADALKNPAVLVRAWRQLSETIRANQRIVFFARRPDVLPIIHEAVNAGHAQLLIRPSRADLIALYSMAEAFVFPSWIEGFGIPILEAMTCGAPVIASDRGALPEVVGDAGLLIDAEDDIQLARHLTRVLDTPAISQQLREQGFVRAAQFSWRNTAQSILDSYKRVVSQRSELPKAGYGNRQGM